MTVEIIPQSRNIEHLEHFIRKWLDIFARFGVRPHVAAEHHFEGDTIFAKPLAYAPEESGEDKARLLRQTRQVIDRVLT